MGDHVRFEADTEDDDERLDRVIRRHLERILAHAVSTREARRLVESGSVRVGGGVARRASARMGVGARIEVVDPARTLDAARTHRSARTELTPARILFEDAFVVAVDKPAGLPTHETRDAARDHLLSAVRRLSSDRAAEAEAPALGELFAAHRLDAETSGVVLLAKDRATAEKLGALFETREVTKIYLAAVKPAASSASSAALSGSFVVKDYLDSRAGRAVRVRSGGRPAETAFTVLARHDDGVTLVEARPRTGRMHQIRVHLAESGAPILGDQLYGARVLPGIDRLMLHAHRLELAHPVTSEPLVLEAPIPEAFVRFVPSATGR